MLLRIIYRDNASNWYMNTCLLEQDAGATNAKTVVCRPRPGGEEALSCLKG